MEGFANPVAYELCETVPIDVPKHCSGDIIQLLLATIVVSSKKYMVALMKMSVNICECMRESKCCQVNSNIVMQFGLSWNGVSCSFVTFRGS